MPAPDADGVREKAASWIKPAARAGYVANGVVYTVVGILALEAAVGPGSARVNREDALDAILLQPLGQMLLIIVGAALIGFALGQVLMSFRSPQKEDRARLIGLANRGAHFATGILHGSLAVAALELALQGIRSGGGSRNVHDWTALLLQQRWGRWIVAGAGVAVVALGLYEWFKAYTGRFLTAFLRHEMNATVESWTLVLGRIGYAARGAVYVIMGVFLAQAAYFYDPQQAGGLGKVLGTLAVQPYGPYLLGAAGAGLIAFGLYAMFLGRYRDFAI